MAGGMLVEAAGLVVRHGAGKAATRALDGVDLAIAPGEFVAIMGPSGSGKTTLVTQLGLLDRPSAGRVAFRGEDVTALGADARAALRNRHVGFVFQAYHLLARRDAIGNVELPLLYRGVGRRERRRRAGEMLARVGLADRAGARPAELSGGEQQRVAIARALVGDPDLVIADEPTGALDTRSGAMVLDLLAGIRAEGRTVVLVTHDPAVAVRASRLVLLSDGRVLRDGPMPAARLAETA